VKKIRSHSEEIFLIADDVDGMVIYDLLNIYQLKRYRIPQWVFCLYSFSEPFLCQKSIC